MNMDETIDLAMVAINGVPEETRRTLALVYSIAYKRGANDALEGQIEQFTA